MYSILVKSGNNAFQYVKGEDGQPFKGDDMETKEKVRELMEDKPIGNIVVVKNTILTVDLTIEDEV